MELQSRNVAFLSAQTYYKYKAWSERLVRKMREREDGEKDGRGSDPGVL